MGVIFFICSLVVLLIYWLLRFKFESIDDDLDIRHHKQVASLKQNNNRLQRLGSSNTFDELKKLEAEVSKDLLELKNIERTRKRVGRIRLFTNLSLWVLSIVFLILIKFENYDSSY